MVVFTEVHVPKNVHSSVTQDLRKVSHINLVLNITKHTSTNILHSSGESHPVWSHHSLEVRGHYGLELFYLYSQVSEAVSSTNQRCHGNVDGEWLIASVL